MCRKPLELPSKRVSGGQINGELDAVVDVDKKRHGHAWDMNGSISLSHDTLVDEYIRLIG